MLTFFILISNWPLGTGEVAAKQQKFNDIIKGQRIALAVSAGGCGTTKFMNALAAHLSQFNISVNREDDKDNLKHRTPFKLIEVGLTA